jgi:hypothetical protein
MHQTRRLLATAAVVSLGFAACADDDDETLESLVDDAEDAARTAVTEAEEAAEELGADAAETAVRNMAAEFGAAQFAESGHPLQGEGLSCEATASDSLDSVSVECSGATEEDAEAVLVGETTEFPGESGAALTGNFTGTVDGEEVFATDTLGG